MQVAFGGGLGQNTPDGEVGGVRLHGDGKVSLEVGEDWSCCEGCLHKKLKRGRGVSTALRADQVFKVSFSTPECCLPFMTFLNPYMMISIPQIDFL